jgi:hypothetical protein
LTKLRAVFVFQIRLWLRRETLGFRQTLERDGLTVELTLPRGPDDFRTWGLFENEEYRAVGLPSAGTEDDPEQIVTANVIRVVVETEGDVTAADFDDEERYEEAVDCALPIFDHANDVARGVANDLLAWARSQYQHSWLGLSSEPAQELGPASLIEAESGRRFPIGHSYHHVSQLRDTDLALGLSEIQALLGSVRAEASPPIPESLLSDAQFLAWELNPPDATRAVLMAAIACELKVKKSLRDRCPDDQADLLDFVLENPREITVTAADGLFDKLMEVAQGRSLRKADRELFKRIRRLFEVRNDIAHRGLAPAPEEASGLVRAARDAFTWLDEEDGKMAP